MNVNWPLIGLTGAGYAIAGIAWLTAACVAAPLIGRWLRRAAAEQTRKPPAQDASTRPEPRQPPVTEEAPGPPRNRPAPPAPGHGGLLKRTDAYACGRTVVFDYDRGTRLLTRACQCHPRVDWDAEIRKLLS